MRKAASGRIRIAGRCRGEGLGYVALWSKERMRELDACARVGDVPVPCALLPVEAPWEMATIDARAHAAWVLVVPLLERSCVITLRVGTVTVCELTFPPLGSKVSSRLLSVARPEVATLLRGFEQRPNAGRAKACVRDVWPSDEGMVVWRIVAEFPVGSPGATPGLAVFDQLAQRVPAELVVMEDQVVPSAHNPHDPSLTMRLVTFACMLPEGVRSFYVEASLAGHRCFTGMNAPRAIGMLEGRRRLIAGAEGDAGYAAWFARQRATDVELARQQAASREDGPLVSIVAPDVAGALTSSLEAQSYTRWELGDHGDYVAFLRAGCVLEPDALWQFVSAMRAQPEADVLYCDEDVWDGAVVREPWFKSFPNYGSMYARNAVGNLLVVSAQVLADVRRYGALEEGAELYDLALRAFELARKVVHVPRVLCHAPAEGRLMQGETYEAGRRALEEHLARRGIAATVGEGVLAGTYRVRYELPDPRPLVSIVVPTRDQAGLLDACVSSILERSTYENFEVVLVENNSVDDRTFALYDELRARDERVKVVVWEPPEPGVFNYSALVNCGVRHSAGAYVVLLNNDTEVIEPTWLEEMLGCLMRPEVGIVGAKLLFRDGLIQHVGMVANPNGDNCHVFQNLTRTAPGSCLAAVMPGDYSMVTGACQMDSRALFDELGGYDEALAVGFNDTDFCLRVGKAGYAVTVAAYALLYHREFSTRGRESTDARQRARLLRERAYVMSRHAEFYAHGDPALNPNTNPFGAYGELAW